MLSSKTHGLQYSKNYLSSYALQEENLAYIQNIQTIGSEDSILPQGIAFSLKRVLGGLEMEKDRVSSAFCYLYSINFTIADSQFTKQFRDSKYYSYFFEI